MQIRSRSLLPLLALSITLSVAARQRAVRHPSPAEGGPTFSNEVVRILQDNCQTCHRDGGVAPFSLVTYADVKSRAAQVRLMTQTRQMPPWKPAEGCGDFQDSRRLSQDTIDTIARWVERGAPEGDPASLPPPREFSDGWALGTPDLVLSNSEPFTPPQNTDTYRCFTIPTNLVSNAYVAAVDTRPGDRATVHHVLTFIDTTGASVALDEAEPGPGYTCFGGPGFSTTGTLGGWAPGSAPLEMPDDVAFELPAASRVVMQVHYHPHGDHPEADLTELGVYFSKEPPAKLMRVLPLINDTFTIPPNDSNYRVDAVFPLLTPFPMKVWFVAPHMHLLGRRMRVEVKRPNAPEECLIDIPDWDFNWQGAYRYTAPLDIPAGSRLSLSAWYDNSASNPRNPNDPPKAVSWGEATTDEMCLAFLGVTIE